MTMTQSRTAPRSCSCSSSYYSTFTLTWVCGQIVLSERLRGHIRPRDIALTCGAPGAGGARERPRGTAEARPAAPSCRPGQPLALPGRAGRRRPGHQAGRRVRQIALAGVSVVVGAGWWLLAVSLWPESARPYIGGSTNNSTWELALGYNGLGRILGGSGNGGGGGGSFGGTSGLLRLFNAEFGTQISWLLPAALLLGAAAVWFVRRAPRARELRGALVLWGGWTLVTGLTFSLMSGTIHPYYAVALARLVRLGRLTDALAVPGLRRRGRDPLVRRGRQPGRRPGREHRLLRHGDHRVGAGALHGDDGRRADGLRHDVADVLTAGPAAPDELLAPVRRIGARPDGRHSPERSARHREDIERHVMAVSATATCRSIGAHHRSARSCCRAHRTVPLDPPRSLTASARRGRPRSFRKNYLTR